MRKFLLLTHFIIFFNQLDAITLVYNMRIRRTFAPANIVEKMNIKGPLWAASVVPIIQKQDNSIIDSVSNININQKRLSVGSLFNIRFIPSRSFWLEATTGIENERAKAKGIPTFSISRTGFDDVVVTGGFNKFLTKDTQGVLYGLVGSPTRRKVEPFENFGTLVGTRFFGVGVGSEISYSIINSLKKSLGIIFQNRFIHFFSRNFQPILPADARVQPGNVTDLLGAIQYRKRRTIIEAGYNPTFFTNQAIIFSTQTIKTPGFVRHNAYARINLVSKHILSLKKPFIFGAGFSIGRSKRFDAKIYSVWLNITSVF
ncbi:MAG: hypothetical protein WDZ41_02455 [Candidatus Babeliales bacterium]